MRNNSESVGVKHLVKEMLKNPDFLSVAANVNSRTLWYTLYDLTAGTIEVDFYLNSDVTTDGEYHEERSEVFRFDILTFEKVTT